MTEFRRASNDLRATFEREMQTLERENQSIKETTREAARQITEATYDAVPKETMWNPLEDVMKEEINLDPTPAIETASNAEEGQESAQSPAPVSASEVSGAESTPSETADNEPISVGIEGTVPRGSASEEKSKNS
jgi:sec-independent protein translocase protein TatA